MKRVLGLFGCLCAVSLAMSHLPGEDETSVDLGKGKVTIHYGTPTLGERKIDELIKPGFAWRMGMNKPTTLETSVALDFTGKQLAPGQYTLFARSDEAKNWTLLFSSSTAGRLDPSSVVLEIPLSFKQDTESQDPLKITLEKAGDGAALMVAWGSYRLQGAFKTAA